MESILWFLLGLGVGLLADFILVLVMLKPLKDRINKLEAWLRIYDRADKQ